MLKRLAWGPALAACGIGLASGVGAVFACGPLLIKGVMAGLKWLKGKFVEFAGPPAHRRVRCCALDFVPWILASLSCGHNITLISHWGGSFF